MELIYRPILLLICLPALLTFHYYKTKLALEPFFLRVESASATWRSAGGTYLLQSSTKSGYNNSLNVTRIFWKPRDLFFSVEGTTSSFSIRESDTEPSCLYHPSPAVTPVCDKRSKLEGNYYDSQGNLLFSVIRTQRRSNMALATNKNWKLVTQDIPATSALIGLNVALSYNYWDRRVNPMSVAKIYDSMVHHPFEIWRTFSGATAHFEVWHLGFNMLSFIALGREIEPRLSTIVFLFYNISLMPIVTALWLLLQWFGVQFFQRANQQRVPTVGFSGVLFAWIAVASLEQSQTCPVVFFPNLCFQTYKAGVFKFTLGPMVQLVVMQVLLPRVSFYGHLSGIIAGFLVHWGLLPIRYVQPSVLIPFLYCCYLQLFRRIRVCNIMTTRCNLALPNLTCLMFQAAVLCLSGFVFSGDSVMDFAMTFFYWIVVQLSGRDSTDRHVLIKATVVSVVIVIVSDAIKLGFVSVFRGVLSLSSITLLLRLIGLFWMLVSSGALELETEDGIFERTLSCVVLDFCRSMKESPISPRDRNPLPISDEGNRLGGTIFGQNGERPVSRLLEIA